MNMDDMLRRPDGRSMYYILEGHEVVPATSWEQWAQWMGENKYRLRAVDAEGMDPCRVGSTHIGDVWVSTVFLAIDHGWHGDPILFETMVFDESGGEPDFGAEHDMDRYSSWTEAEAGHVAMVEWVKAQVAKR